MNDARSRFSVWLRWPLAAFAGAGAIGGLALMNQKGGSSTLVDRTKVAFQEDPEAGDTRPIIAENQGADLGFEFVRHTPPTDILIPPGMVYVPGGETEIGFAGGPEWERPTYRATIKPFYMDVHPVTVAEYRRFIEATGYRTQAEEFGHGAVFDYKTHQWELRDGATWRFPFGPVEAAAADDHPVTQVSWNDAVAYASWANKRLPTEAEWEHAARNAQNGGPRYSWGQEMFVDGRYMTNFWQGRFPDVNTIADGFLATAPVGMFAKTHLGLTDMGGNVWEWCEDWFRYYDERGRPFVVRLDSQKVHRGGSFLCDPSVCHGFRVSARASSTPETGLCHVGFRCVKEIQGATVESDEATRER